MSEQVRETIEITTPNGHKVVTKTYLTGREYREVEKVYLKAVNFDPALRQTTTKFEPATMQEAENANIQQYVVSVNGVSENVLDLILDMKVEDFDFVKNHIQSIGTPVEGKKKPQS